MITLTLFGGPFEGEVGSVVSLDQSVARTDLSGNEHVYRNLCGSWYDRDPRGAKTDEEAYFFHASIAAQGEPAALAYADAAGY